MGKAVYIEPSDESSLSDKREDIRKTKAKGKGKARAAPKDLSSSDEQEDLVVEGRTGKNENGLEDNEEEEDGDKGEEDEEEQGKDFW
jgi:hypothetical protein